VYLSDEAIAVCFEDSENQISVGDEIVSLKLHYNEDLIMDTRGIVLRIEQLRKILLQKTFM